MRSIASGSRCLYSHVLLTKFMAFARELRKPFSRNNSRNKFTNHRPKFTDHRPKFANHRTNIPKFVDMLVLSSVFVFYDFYRLLSGDVTCLRCSCLLFLPVLPEALVDQGTDSANSKITTTKSSAELADCPFEDQSSNKPSRQAQSTEVDAIRYCPKW